MRTLRIIVALFILGVSSWAMSPVRAHLDQRVELMAVLYYLAEHAGPRKVTTDAENSYTKSVDGKFKDFLLHPAVLNLRELLQKGFSFDAPFRFAFELGPNLDAPHQFSHYLVKRAGSRDALETLRRHLVLFERQSGFRSFYREKLREIQPSIFDIQTILNSDQTMDGIEKFTGIKFKQTTIYISPLISGNFGGIESRSHRDLRAFVICGAWPREDGKFTIGTKDVIRHLLLHECGHAIFEPYLSRHTSLMQASSSLYGPVAKWMKPAGYGSWEFVVGESMVHALAFRIETEHLSPDDRNQKLKELRLQGYFYVPILINELAEFESSGGRPFEVMVKRMLTSLARLKPDSSFYEVPFTSTVWEAVYDHDRLIFIYPTNELDSGVQAKIQNYVRKIRDFIEPNARIVSDSEALSMDIRGAVPMAYGTPHGNRWIEQQLNRLPIKIHQDAFSLGGQFFQGPGIRVIAALPNPSDATKGAVLYMAIRPEDVLNINSIPHGQTDYVVAQSTEVRASGFFTQRRAESH